VTLGSVAYNYFNSVSSAVTRIETAVRPDGSVRADAVKGVIDMGQANLYAQYDAATRQDVLGMLFENNDSTSELYGAMAIGTQGFMISKAKDEDGNWIWSTFGTAAGFNADYITAGTITAALIAAHSIGVSKLTGSIANGNWEIDLDDGTLTIGDITANNIKGGTLTLGGANNVNGSMQVLDASGNLLETINNDGFIAYGDTTKATFDETGLKIENANDSTKYVTLESSVDLDGYIQRMFLPSTRYSTERFWWYYGNYKTASLKLIDDTYQASNLSAYGLEAQGLLAIDYLRAYRIFSQLATIESGSFTKLSATHLYVDGALTFYRLTTPTLSSLPVRLYDPNGIGYITASSVVMPGSLVLSNPSAQTSDWTIDTGSGYLTISGSISGSTTATFILIGLRDEATLSTTRP
jgi:hypothetical protein